MSKPKARTLANKNARNIAVNCLNAFEYRGMRIQDSLENIFQGQVVSDSDKRLAYELAAGCCRQSITLDKFIEIYSSRGLRKIEPTLRQIIRAGLYQLMFLQGTPDFAAVNEAVRQTRAAGLMNAATFVNAVLRSVQRDIEGPMTADKQGNPRRILWLDPEKGLRFARDLFADPLKHPAKYLSQACAHPLWLVQRWLKHHDVETVRRMCLANNQRPHPAIRVNRLRCQTTAMEQRLQEAEIAFTSAANHVIHLHQPVNPENLPGYTEGWFSVQDATAARTAPLLAPQPGQAILDLCAAPGGKSTHLAELMGNEGRIVACDIRQEKLDRINANARRLGIDIIRTALRDDFERVCREEGPFDAVLVDAPCSNTGVMSRRVEVRHVLKPAAMRDLSRLQLGLLGRAAAALKPGGKILYSTCSIDSMENELVSKRFLEQHPHFTLTEQKLTLPRAGVPSHDGGYLALFVYRSGN